MPTGIYIRTEETKQRMRSSKLGEKNPMFGKMRCGACNPMFGKQHTESTKQKIRKAHLGISFSDKHRHSIGQSGIGRHPSQETIQKLCKAKAGVHHPLFGKRHSKETRCKMRSSALQRVLAQGGLPLVGCNETSFLNTQEQIDGVTILRQYPIQKLGYIVDGYCVETNTVYEVYEKHHNWQVQKDLQRETEICNLLSCNFHIIWDR